MVGIGELSKWRDGCPLVIGGSRGPHSLAVAGNGPDHRLRIHIHRVKNPLLPIEGWGQPQPLQGIGSELGEQDCRILVECALVGSRLSLGVGHPGYEVPVKFRSALQFGGIIGHQPVVHGRDRDDIVALPFVQHAFVQGSLEDHLGLLLTEGLRERIHYLLLADMLLWLNICNGACDTTEFSALEFSHPCLIKPNPPRPPFFQPLWSEFPPGRLQLFQGRPPHTP